MIARSGVLLALLVPVTQPFAQPTSSPPRRAHHSLVYDEANRRVLLWGGSSPFENGDCCGMFNDLWSFDGKAWTSLGKTGPEASGIQLAYDSRQNRVVGFGGYVGGGGSLGDLRVLTNNAWTSLGRHPEIVAAEPGFVFDTRRNRFVAFGGSAGRGQTHGDTWEWDGGAWHKLAIDGPPARQAHVMVFDSRRNRVVLFGGGGVSPPGQAPLRLDDTWEFDGTAWKQLAVTGPGPRMAAGAAFDSKRGLVIVFGGMNPTGMLNDTWAWNGTAWRKLADTGPEARAMGYLAYDKNRDRVVLFGGRKGWPNDLNDTWEWNGTTWKRVP
jgi:hypothetical protein